MTANLDNDKTADFIERIRAAQADGTALEIRGGNSKAFYGRTPVGAPLDIRGHSGIVSYEPTELVLTARAGTPLREIETILAESRQMLAFEPPHYGGEPTLGGAVAAGLSGPRRFAVGAVRDFVLGVRLINAQGEHMRFGGEVMKNVAGFDVSRVMAGAMGTLGLITEVSVKVLPAAERETTLALELPREHVAGLVDQWLGEALPVSASAHDGSRLHVRLSGPSGTVTAARERIGGEELTDGVAFWRGVRDHTLPFFSDGEEALWRLSLPAHPAELALPDAVFSEWGDRLRWLRSNAPAADVRAAVEAVGGHATLFRGGDRSEAFTPLAPGVRTLHENLKRAFDPKGIFNPGRIYAGL